jgi:hypothetical protein
MKVKGGQSEGRSLGSIGEKERILRGKMTKLYCIIPMRTA